MRTVKLNTGVVVTFNSKDEIISVSSPYHKNEPPRKLSTLRYAVSQLKKVIDTVYYDDGLPYWNGKI